MNHQTGMVERQSSSLSSRRASRYAFRQQQKLNKKKGKILSICTQNFNGTMGEVQVEEAYLQMQRLRVGILCGQEGRRPTSAMTRWDTNELFIAFETENEFENVNMKKDGNFFILSAEWKDAFVKGGKQMKRFCPRLVAIRIPISATSSLYIINIHTPDDSKPKLVRDMFAQRLEMAIGEAKSGDILVMAGDTNACTGNNTAYHDGVCGPFGDPYINSAGRALRLIAAVHQLLDLTTWEE